MLARPTARVPARAAGPVTGRRPPGTWGVRDRRFRTLALGVFPVVLLVAVVLPLVVRGAIPPGPLLVVAFAVEAVALWRCADPAITTDGARARRVAFGLTASAVTGLIVGAVLFMAVLIAAFGDGP